jgi:ADP-ribosylation factor related protein 1
MNKVEGVDIQSSRINVWDLGGQKDLHSIWEGYYSECHAIVFEVNVVLFLYV